MQAEGRKSINNNNKQTSNAVAQTSQSYASVVSNTINNDGEISSINNTSITNNKQNLNSEQKIFLTDETSVDKNKIAASTEQKEGNISKVNIPDEKSGKIVDSQAVVPERKVILLENKVINATINSSPMAGLLKRGLSLDADKFPTVPVMDPEQQKQREFEVKF
jgi:hypothetical protein